MRKSLLAGVVAGSLSLFAGGVAFATPSPNGPGQPGSIPTGPGSPGTTCGNPTGNANNAPGMNSTTGGATTSQSPFNSAGNAGLHYAGNPGTASAANSNSPDAVSQYDVACFQQTSNPGHS